MADLTSLWRLNRPELAERLAQRAKAKERIALFGPRQTGKTSLLREEVIPLVESAGMVAAYIECWADKSDPLGSINYALQKALDNLRVVPAGLKRTLKTPVKKIGVVGASIDLGDAPKRAIPSSKYLQVDALLTSLLEETKKDVLLVFDEFQAFAAVPEADAAAAALRAALTQATKRVGVIFSGSSEVLLLEMFSRSRTPLYGFANPEPYPLLGADFVAHVAKKFKRTTGRDLDRREALAVLETLGAQPEPFLNAVANAMANPRWGVADGMGAMLDPKVRNKWTVNWFSLTAIQRATLRVVFDGLQPTAAATMKAMAAALAEPSVQGSSITRALESLTDKGLVEREFSSSGRQYVVSDPVMRAWLTQNRNLAPRDDG